MRWKHLCEYQVTLYSCRNLITDWFLLQLFYEWIFFSSFIKNVYLLLKAVGLQFSYLIPTFINEYF